MSASGFWGPWLSLCGCRRPGLFCLLVHQLIDQLIDSFIYGIPSLCALCAPCCPGGLLCAGLRDPLAPRLALKGQWHARPWRLVLVLAGGGQAGGRASPGGLGWRGVA